MNIAMEFTVIDCPRCGLHFAINADYEKRRRADHQQFRCPEGHWQAFQGDTETERLRKLARERSDIIIKLQGERADLQRRLSRKRK